MSYLTLEQLKEFLRELTDDLNSPLSLARDAAEAETNAFLGFDVADQYGSEGPPADVLIATCLLAQVHSDSGTVQDAEHRRIAAQRLLLPYRLNTGIGEAA